MKNNRGFMMAEVVVVSSIVLIVLGTLFISYNKLLSTYKTRVTYYDTVTLYRLRFYRDVLIENDILTKAQGDLKTGSSKVKLIYDVNNNNSGMLSLRDEERVGFEEDKVFLIYNNKTNINSQTLKDCAIHETFKDYLNFVSTAVNLTKTNYVMVMERCNAKSSDSNIKQNDCRYAYLEVFDGYET